MASLLGANAIPGYTDCDTARGNLCDWDMKTGLRKQCVKRLVKEVGNALAPAYVTAANEDPDLVQGRETYSCYKQGKEVNDVMLLSNVKDEATTVTNEYTQLDIPAGYAYSDALPIPTSQQEMLQHQLDYINKLRAIHNSPPLVLDDTLTAGAQAQADKNQAGPTYGASEKAGVDYEEYHAKHDIMPEMKSNEGGYYLHWPRELYSTIGQYKWT